MKDTVEYTIFIIEPGGEASSKKLDNVQQYAANLGRTLLAEHVWHDESFQLQRASRQGLDCLRGSTRFSESVTDEWLCVYLLCLLSEHFPEAWIETLDDDGQFLLIEAASALPDWLEPDIADARVWIHQGGLFIIEPSSVSQTAVKKLRLVEALSILHNGVDLNNKLNRNRKIEEQAFFRLKGYPRQIRDSLHRTAVTVPRKLATVIIQGPTLVSAAVRAVNSSGAFSLGKVRATSFQDSIFPPEDMVTLHWAFTKIGFAQLKGRSLNPSDSWRRSLKSKGVGEVTEASLDLGAKVCAGFELLVRGDQDSADQAQVQGRHLLLNPILIDLKKETLPLVSDAVIRKYRQDVDDESWLEVDYELFESGLADDEPLPYPKSIDDAKLHASLRHLKSKLHDIADRPSEKAWYSSDDEAYDSEGSLSDDVPSDSAGSESEAQERERVEAENEFSEMMRQLMGMPSQVFEEIMQGGRVHDTRKAADCTPSSHQSQDGHNTAQEELQRLSDLMEAELFRGGQVT